MAIGGSFLKSELIIFHQKAPENSCFVPQLSRLVQVIKRKLVPKREMALAYLQERVQKSEVH